MPPAQALGLSTPSGEKNERDPSLEGEESFLISVFSPAATSYSQKNTGTATRACTNRPSDLVG